MLAFLIALVLLAAAVAGVYLLLKRMGEDGIEAAAPGSCKSGRCGVAPRQSEAGEESCVEVRFVKVSEIGGENGPGRPRPE